MQSPGGTGSRSSWASLACCWWSDPSAQASRRPFSLPIGGAICYSLAAIITRAKCHTIDVGLQALWLNIAFLLLGVLGILAIHLWGSAAVAPGDTFLFGQWKPLHASEWATIAVLAALMLAMAVGVAKAYQSPHPEIIATVEYSYIIFAVFWGYVFFSEVPDGWSLVGMALITLGGLMTVYAGRSRTPEPELEPVR